MFNRTTLLKSGVQFPSPAAASTFVSELVNNLPSAQQQVQAPSSSNITMFGTKLRIRATPDGGVIEVLGPDNIWHLQQVFTNKASELTAPAPSFVRKVKKFV
ncbi:MAG TPA: hypothetical protein VLQ29_15485 [Candidatus Dormibacteraeota bacterium]|nr:hypothetical protein [Candidatus Dormibacteraeota bacterium]